MLEISFVNQSKEVESALLKDNRYFESKQCEEILNIIKNI